MNSFIKDFSLGFMDSITMGMSMSAGMYVSKIPREIIIAALVSETIAGTASMSLSNYIGTENILSSIIICISFILGSLIVISSYYYTTTATAGFYNSIIYGILSLSIFSYFRSIYLETTFTDSLFKTLFTGLVSVLFTYYISKPT